MASRPGAKAWHDTTGLGRGEIFLAPVGSLELVTGRPLAVPPLLIETTQLDHIHTAVHQWLRASYPDNAASLLAAPELTDWNSRLFTVKLEESLTVGFWQSENPDHNKPIAIEGDLSAAGMSFAVITPPAGTPSSPTASSRARSTPSTPQRST